MSEREGDALRRVLQAVAKESESLRLLKSDPEALAERYRLNPDELDALKLADVLVSVRPLRRREITFETGSTFTAGRMKNVTFETGSTFTAGRLRGEELTFETGTTITASGIRGVLQGIALESKTLQRLRVDPESLIDELGIDRSELAKLKGAQISVAMRPVAVTFETGSTIVV